MPERCTVGYMLNIYMSILLFISWICNKPIVWTNKIRKWVFYLMLRDWLLYRVFNYLIYCVNSLILLFSILIFFCIKIETLVGIWIQISVIRINKGALPALTFSIIYWDSWLDSKLIFERPQGLEPESIS